MRLGRLFAVTFAAVLLLAGISRAAEWRVPKDFPTIQAAIDSSQVLGGDTIVVGPGKHAGATVTKAVTIRGVGHPKIVDGPVVSPLGKAGFYFPPGGEGSGTTITGFYFDRVEFPVFSRGADDVTVTRNTLMWSLQGITNWGYEQWGNGWEITDNDVQGLYTNCGGGIGILIGDFMGGTVSNNVIARNQIRGPVLVPRGECGGYNAPGIALYADFREGAAGATLEANRVEKNRVLLHSGARRLGHTTGPVTVVGIELSDTRDDPGLFGIVLNDVVYNDLRGMKVPFSFTPKQLVTANTIEHNLTAGHRGFASNGLEGDALTAATTETAGSAPVR